MYTREEEAWGKKGKRGQPTINCMVFSWVTAVDLIRIFNWHLVLKSKVATPCKICARSESCCIHYSLILYQACLSHAAEHLNAAVALSRGKTNLVLSWLAARDCISTSSTKCEDAVSVESEGNRIGQHPWEKGKKNKIQVFSLGGKKKSETSEVLWECCSGWRFLKRLFELLTNPPEFLSFCL